LADVGVVVQDVRDRLHGHASELSDIGHRRHGESFLGGSRFAGRLIWRQSTGGGTLGGGPWTSSRREPCAGRRSRYIVSTRRDISRRSESSRLEEPVTPTTDWAFRASDVTKVYPGGA